MEEDRKKLKVDINEKNVDVNYEGSGIIIDITISIVAKIASLVKALFPHKKKDPIE